MSQNENMAEFHISKGKNIFIWGEGLLHLFYTNKVLILIKMMTLLLLLVFYTHKIIKHFMF
jgi:hypothetical protein